ncbi:histidine kinase-like ATPase [Tribonema minus]|uniref:Histidine kinase-like ATPase n=1 Tax=Tribonema minus TaxID=303371 RepID=A0A835Z0U1_9STRA|nr:histidine kinase-like ATPase [Tribonema minus]
MGVREMIAMTFPDMRLDLIERGAGVPWMLVIGEDVTADWTSQTAQSRLADAKLALALSTAHDLRTPLMNFALVLDYLRLPGAAEDADDVLDEADTNVEVMKSVIAQTIDVGRLVCGHHVQPNVQPVNLTNLVRRLKIVCGVTDTSVPVTYVTDVEDFIMLTDPEWLWQICFNLLMNAKRFTLRGSIRFTMRATSTRHLVVEVRDTGIGIPVEDREIIFERFRTLQNRKQESTGLGLYIVKSKTELLGGTVAVYSNNDSECGSVFVVTLPLELAEDEPGPEEQEEPLLQRVVDSSAASVLIIEDTSSVRRLMKRILTRFHVHEAVNGAEALQMMQKHMYTVVFCDVFMPVMDGIQCVRQLREFERRTGRDRQYIVMMSANNLSNTDDFDMKLPKPVSSKALLQTVLDRLEYQGQ